MPAPHLRPRILSALAALSFVACGGQLAPALQCAKDGGAAWLEARSEHFTLKTDLPKADATARLAAFEDVYALLEIVAFPPKGTRTARPTVIVFARDQDYQALSTSNAAAYFRSRLPQDLESAPTVVMPSGFDAEAREIFTHELTHQMMHRTFATTPVWLNEGLADYFSTIRVENGRAILGGFVGRLAATPSLLPTVSEIVHAPRAAFYGTAGYAAESRDAARAHHAYYSGAWHLVNMLRNGPDAYRARFKVLVDALDRGTPSDAAWAAFAKPFGDETIERDFERYVTAERSDFAMDLPPRAPSRNAPSYRDMTDGEVHLLWARLVPWTGVTRPLAERELARAEEHGGETAPLAFWRARKQALDGETDLAKAELDALLRKAPKDPELLYARARLELGAKARGGGRPGQGQAHEANLARLANGLETYGTTAEERLFAAALHADRGESDAAMIGAAKALAEDPLCAPCHAVLAEAHFQLGDATGAVESAERALALLPEDASDAFLKAALARYRARAASTPR